jgi:hypothetical protein
MSEFADNLSEYYLFKNGSAVWIHLNLIGTDNLRNLG